MLKRRSQLFLSPNPPFASVPLSANLWIKPLISSNPQIKHLKSLNLAMGRKKTVSKRPRSDVTEAMREKRSKFREDPLHHGEREEPSSSRRTPSMQMRQVMSGRRILFNFLEEIELELGDKIEEQGWVYFCS